MCQLRQFLEINLIWFGQEILIFSMDRDWITISLSIQFSNQSENDFDTRHSIFDFENGLSWLWVMTLYIYLAAIFMFKNSTCTIKACEKDNGKSFPSISPTLKNFSILSTHKHFVCVRYCCVVQYFSVRCQSISKFHWILSINWRSTFDILWMRMVFFATGITHYDDYQLCQKNNVCAVVFISRSSFSFLS